MFGVEANKEREEVKVACMTTDFAMQVRQLCHYEIGFYMSYSILLYEQNEISPSSFDRALRNGRSVQQDSQILGVSLKSNDIFLNN